LRWFQAAATLIHWQKFARPRLMPAFARATVWEFARRVVSQRGSNFAFKGEQ